MSDIRTQAQDRPDPPAPRPVSSRAEAETLVKHMLDVMDTLLGTVEEETQLVRAGKLKEASDMEASKAELSRLYVADTMRIRESKAYLAKTMPETLDHLRRKHEEFRAVLQINLTVLATAHAVSESIMRGVSDEMARKATPQAYGASGRATAPGASAQQPLTVSRAL
jgi:hypothetical protein